MAIFGKPKTKENAIPPVAPEKKPGEGQEAMKNAEDAVVDVNGTQVPLYELVEAYKMKMGAGDTPSPLTPEDMVEVEGFGQVSVADLIAAYGPAGEAQEGEPVENAEPPTDTPGVSPNDPKKMNNAAPKPKPAVNAALRNAALNPEGEKTGRGVETESQRLERGHARYSIPVKNGGSK